MADEGTPNTGEPGTPAAPPSNQDGPPKTWEEVFQHARFKELNERAKKAEAALAKLEADAKTAREKELAEQQKWQELAEQYKGQLAAEKTERLKLQAAQAAGLPVELASRLQGTDEAALKEDATRLAALLKPSGGPGVPPRSNGQPPQKFTEAQLRDPAFVREHVREILEAG